MKKPTDPDVANVDEVAAMLGVGKRQVYEATRRPVNPIPHQRIGDRVLFRRSAVLEWLGASPRRAEGTQHE